MRERPRDLLEAMARVGYGARGIVYLVIGSLALLAAIGAGGRTTGAGGALRTVYDQPLGAALLGILAIGLFGFSFWRAIQAAVDADHLGRSWRALGRRAGYALGAVAHAGLGCLALALLLDRGVVPDDDDKVTRDWTAWLLGEPYGRWAVAAIGLGVAIAGLGMVAMACTRRIERRLALDGKAPGWALPIGRIGFIARGVVFVVIGAFLVVGAVRFNSGEARGLAGALQALQQQPYGWALLGLVALGLAAFGVLGLVQAMHRRIDAPPVERVISA